MLSTLSVMHKRCERPPDASSRIGLKATLTVIAGESDLVYRVSARSVVLGTTQIFVYRVICAELLAARLNSCFSAC